jgi:hypothetical protein
VGLEHTITASERAKIVDALDRSANVTGDTRSYAVKSILCSKGTKRFETSIIWLWWSKKRRNLLVSYVTVAGTSDQRLNNNNNIIIIRLRVAALRDLSPADTVACWRFSKRLHSSIFCYWRRALHPGNSSCPKVEDFALRLWHKTIHVTGTKQWRRGLGELLTSQMLKVKMKNCPSA